MPKPFMDGTEPLYSTASLNFYETQPWNGIVNYELLIADHNRGQNSSGYSSLNSIHLYAVHGKNKNGTNVSNRKTKQSTNS